MGVDQATAEHPRVTGTNVTPLPPLRPSVPELRQGVCEKALRLAADSPDISAKLGLTHVQNLSEVGPAQATHDKLKRFYVQWAKM